MFELMNRGLLAAAVTMVLGVAPAHAAGNNGIEGDASAGKAKAAACAACHGANGNSSNPEWPKLAGQGEKYLIKQMKEIDSGVRPVPMMAGQLAGKSEQDIADIAAYYAAQEISGGQADPALVELGQNVFRGGISERGVPACAACHAADGSGVAAAGFPALAGQHAVYTAKQLRDYRKAADGDPSGRANDGDEIRVMRMISFRLSDAEIDALASYLQGLR